MPIMITWGPAGQSGCTESTTGWSCSRLTTSAGQCVEVCDDCPFLQARGLTNNCVNSIRVYGDGAWVLYEEPNYRGRMYIVERKNYCNFMEWQAENHNIQSVRRVANYF
ncbi:Gamma-crystallin N-A [Larimichthys crocea]|uniref:Uncharacterized protein n=1 Tax=Larimichthys crocea TaxID=215358 RepID=A0ACD3QRE1_LARCR|nr:Gamma-crystallin N-A [Larimichthys crocea]